MSRPQDLPPAVEGITPFTDTLRMLDGGTISEKLSEKLRDLNADLSTHAASHSKAKGKLVLTLDFTHEKGLVMVVADITVKQPKEKEAPTALFLTPGNNLARTDPRQLEMGVRGAVDRLRGLGAEVTANVSEREVIFSPPRSKNPETTHGQ